MNVMAWYNHIKYKVTEVMLTIRLVFTNGLKLFYRIRNSDVCSISYCA